MQRLELLWCIGVFTKMHGEQKGNIGLRHQLFGPARKIAPQPRIDGEHGSIQMWMRLHDARQFPQIVDFGFVCIRSIGFFVPMPVILIACMKQRLAGHLYNEAYACIGGTKGFNTDKIILMAFVRMDIVNKRNPGRISI